MSRVVALLVVMAASAVVAVAAMTNAPSEAAVPAPVACSAPAHERPSPSATSQDLTVSVPAIAVVDFIDGHPVRATTNTRHAPLAGDTVYLRSTTGVLTEASLAQSALVTNATWTPNRHGGRCSSDSWVVNSSR